MRRAHELPTPLPNKARQPTRNGTLLHCISRKFSHPANCLLLAAAAAAAAAAVPYLPQRCPGLEEQLEALMPDRSPAMISVLQYFEQVRGRGAWLTQAERVCVKCTDKLSVRGDGGHSHSASSKHDKHWLHAK
jgi:hypothetical protein